MAAVWELLRVVMIALVATLLATSAEAQPSAADRAAAKVLFDEGRQLMSEGKLAQACDKLEESLRLGGGAGSQFNLAECQARRKLFASAWVNYLEVAKITREAGQEARADVAQKRAAEVEKRMMKLRLDVAEPTAPGLELRRNHVIIPRAQWKTSIPVDPGIYLIEAEAVGYQSWSKRVRVHREGLVIYIRVPPLRPIGAELVEEKEKTEEPDGGVASDWRLHAAIASTALSHVGVGLFLWGLLEVNSVQNEPSFEAYRAGFSPNVNVCEQARDGVVAVDPGAATPADAAEMCDKVDDLEVVEYVGAASAAVFAGLGIAFFATSPTLRGKSAAGRDGRHLVVVPQLGPGYAGLVLGHRW